MAPLATRRARLHALCTVRYNQSLTQDSFNQSAHRSTSHQAWIRATIILILLPLIGTVLPSPVLASKNPSPDLSLNARAVVDSINQIRGSYGLPHLAINDYLVQAAQNHAIDMVTHSHHSHTGTDGSSVRVRIERTGYGPGNRSGENWVALTDPTKAIDWWMASAPHRANILNGSWQDIGIGSGVNPNSGLNYFVVVFAAKGDGYAAPAPVNNGAAPALQPIPAVLPEFHQVQPGETLSSIATRYGLSWQSVATANNLGEFSILSIGQSVRLPSSGAPTNFSNAVETQNLPYTVAAGDTLFSLGSRFNVPWQTIARHNGLSENSVLSIEQVLQIPVTVTAVNEAILEERAFAPPAITPDYHVVQTGETIIIIALQYNLNWKHLLNINALSDSTLLAVGQTIRLK